MPSPPVVIAHHNSVEPEAGTNLVALPVVPHNSSVTRIASHPGPGTGPAARRVGNVDIARLEDNSDSDGQISFSFNLPAWSVPQP